MKSKNIFLSEYLPYKFQDELNRFIDISRIWLKPDAYWDVGSYYNGARVGDGFVYGCEVYNICNGITKEKTPHPAYTYGSLIRFVNRDLRFHKQRIKLSDYKTKINSLEDFLLLFLLPSDVKILKSFKIFNVNIEEVHKFCEEMFIKYFGHCYRRLSWF